MECWGAMLMPEGMPCRCQERLGTRGNHVCKSEAWASRCIWGGQYLPILLSRVALKQRKKQTRKLFYNIGQHLVKHKSASHIRKAVWLRCHSLHLKRKLGTGSPFDNSKFVSSVSSSLSSSNKVCLLLSQHPNMLKICLFLSFLASLLTF